MRGLLNDCLRSLIGAGIVGLGLGAEILHRIAIRVFSWNQRSLHERYGITHDTPILSYGPCAEELIQEAGRRSGVDARFVFTSGSTARPKGILYTRRRLRLFKWTYMEVFARCYWALPIQRKSLYIFASFSKDNSLTSILIEDRKPPPRPVTLQAPYRVQCHPAIQALASVYGPTAVRLWLLAIANPGVLYSTNPSTLSTFLDEVALDWQKSSRLIRDFCEKPQMFDPMVQRIGRRLESRGSAARLARIARSDSALPLAVWAPGVQAYVCWTGGYVKPFLDRITTHLPSKHYRLIPMFAMATETLETISHFHEGQVAFLPLARGVLYEFIEEGEEDRPDNVRAPDELQPGKTYTMIVSDAYGLRRYQTEDIFRCKGFIAGVPDLQFLRRRGLEYSFTGEKLTAEQVSLACTELRRECAWLRPQDFLTCLPSCPPGQPLPHYKLVNVGMEEGAAIVRSAVAARFDALLCQINSEYRSKREGGRLGQAQFISISLPEFIAKLHPAGGDQWQAQFKFLPLYKRTWESLSDLRSQPSCMEGGEGIALEVRNENRPDA